MTVPLPLHDCSICTRCIPPLHVVQGYHARGTYAPCTYARGALVRLSNFAYAINFWEMPQSGLSHWAEPCFSSLTEASSGFFERVSRCPSCMVASIKQFAKPQD